MSLLSKIQDGKSLSTAEQLTLTARLAVPAILAQLSSILMQYIDASMVGQLGQARSASVGLMSSSLWLFWGVCSMAVMGFTVQVAHRLGAKDSPGARNVLRQSITSALIFAAAATAIGCAIAPFLPHWLGGQPEITHDATLYFLVFTLALPMLTLNYLAGGMLRSAGNMKVPSLLNILMCVLDVIFNFFLIFPSRKLHIMGMDIFCPGADLGVLGAALGTVLAEIVVAVWMMWYLLAVQPDLRLRFRPRGSFTPTRAVLSRAIKISLPMTLEHAIFCGAQITITVIVAPLGMVAIAANAFAVTAESLCYMPGFGIGDAATTLTGQCFGAGRLNLVRRFAYITVGLGMAVMTVMGGIMYLCAPYMMDIMTPVSAIRELGTEVLRIEAWAEPLYAASIVAYGAMVGVGDTLLPAIMNFGSIWLVRIPVAAILAPRVGLTGVWMAMAVELCFRGLIFLWRLISGAWWRNAKPATRTSDEVPANPDAASADALPRVLLEDEE